MSYPSQGKKTPEAPDNSSSYYKSALMKKEDMSKLSPKLDNRSIQRPETLVPKSESSSASCKSVTPPPLPPGSQSGQPPQQPQPQQRTYDSYLNQDSNSSSVSSMDTMNSRGGAHMTSSHMTPHQQPHHPIPHHPHPTPVTYSTMSLVEEHARMSSHQLSQRSPYDSSDIVTTSSEDTYRDVKYNSHMSETDPVTISRPMVTYPTDMNRNYDPSVTNSAGHRPYDPGSTIGVYDRYDTAQSCNIGLGQTQRLYPGYSSEEARSYQEQMSAAQTMMKPAVSEADNSTPIYPRPMYHYDPATGTIPPGFSPAAINLSVKAAQAAAAAAAAAQAQIKSGAPTSPGGSVMDLSTSNVTSSSPQVRTPWSADRCGGGWCCCH